MSQLVRLEGKHSTQNAHCALVKPQPNEKFSDFYCQQWFGTSHAS